MAGRRQGIVITAKHIENFKIASRKAAAVAVAAAAAADANASANATVTATATAKVGDVEGRVIFGVTGSFVDDDDDDKNVDYEKVGSPGFRAPLKQRSQVICSVRSRDVLGRETVRVGGGVGLSDYTPPQEW